MKVKEAAERLLKIADAIDNDAAEVTMFKCGKCNHTATLSSINQRRKSAAEESGENITVAEITVEDKLHCPACDGVMAYVETEASNPYYFDPDKTADDAAVAPDAAPAPVMEEGKEDKGDKGDKEEGKEDKDDKGDKEAALDYDNIERYMNG